jgi:hypothetical protein
MFFLPLNISLTVLGLMLHYKVIRFVATLQSVLHCIQSELVPTQKEVPAPVIDDTVSFQPIKAPQ